MKHFIFILLALALLSGCEVIEQTPFQQCMKECDYVYDYEQENNIPECVDTCLEYMEKCSTINPKDDYGY